MGARLRVMLLDDDEERGEILRSALVQGGHEVVLDSKLSAVDIPREVESFAPDLIIIDTDSPNRDTLEHLCVIGARKPRPIVMFSEDRDGDTIRAAVQAGVSAYVVDGLAADRVQPVIDAAVARFDQIQQLREELLTAQTQLADRKTIERAKGVLMSRKGMSEDDAFRLLRKLAMDRNVKLVQVAGEVVRMSELL